MRKLLLPAAAALALLAIPPMTAVSAAPTVSAAPAVPAAPHSVLTIKKVGGPNVKKNAILKASLEAKSTAKFLTGSSGRHVQEGDVHRQSRQEPDKAWDCHRETSQADL